MESDSALDLLSSLENGHRSRIRRRTQQQQQPITISINATAALTHEAQQQQPAISTADYNNNTPASTSPADGDQHPAVSASLTRRLLAVASIAAIDPHYDQQDSHQAWRHTFVENMNHDFHTGLSRNEAVHRLRQRMNDLRSSNTTNTTPYSVRDDRITPAFNAPTPATGTTDPHHTRINKHQTYLIYCGHQSPSHPSAADNKTDPHQERSSGCGQLISVRTALVLPKSFRFTSHHSLHQDRNGTADSLVRSSSRDFNLLTSDTLPCPNAADRVDQLTQQSFENDPSNPFHPDHPHRPTCTCEKAYLGCLSCGNIVGHSVTSPCDHCRELALFHPQFYYLNRLTALPRYNDLPIAPDLGVARAAHRPEENLMSWSEAARRRKKDIDAGYVPSPVWEEWAICAPRLALLSAPPRLSSQVRHAILMGSLVDDEESSWRDQARRPAIQPASSSLSGLPQSTSSPRTVSNDSRPSHQAGSRLRPTSLSRRPAVRLPAHMSLDRHSALRPRAASSSESWVVREGRSAEEGFPRELLGLRRESGMASYAEGASPAEPANNEAEVKDEDESSLAGTPLEPTPAPSTSNLSRRPRADDDDVMGTDSELLQSGLGSDRPARIIRRRIHSLSRPTPSTLAPSYRSSFRWSGHVCAR
ncbi:hypothetical protein PCANC_23246 [Puccinia coronata f. sp. avenae]|uniref:Uncharacterized protein n=1 Tax=Puccinia coronata f. sp. avenae TaxID=200324 RepID=A0A2N5SS70_9BASI|nr:hypothetical protein PCANC_23246 [Puccinia coronata f. sp. avenae]PLW16076.1 hypothetical protein PCASD_20496 [Puccinia coronata f. sp. avenae]